MSEDWSIQEVEATVADYFDMLDKELRGIAYNKTQHKKQLSQLLEGRSEGAIERKHQNISAILIHLGFPYISGYKPLKNYQRLLFEVVSSRLSDSESLIKLVEEQVNRPANMPVLGDLLSALVDPPTPEPTEDEQRVAGALHRPIMRNNIDYLARESRNRSLGIAGEQFVVQFEVSRLLHAGKEDLASKVEHVAVTIGDGVGFDVRSFDVSGSERYIEVKTTAYGPLTPVFITPNELAISQEVDEQYYLYRTFNFRNQPKLFTKQGALDRTLNLVPSQYLARFA